MLISWHPAYILRTTDPARQAGLRKDLVADLAALQGNAL
uniref:Uncharacterized protein n=1 Tax=Achromobacter ruhlandii TaxID=72557 RepID=A0A482F312_9BURK|nr:hypothetical protein [Achromobacter ruhlandii]